MTEPIESCKARHLPSNNIHFCFPSSFQEREPVGQGFTVHNSPFIVTFPPPFGGAVCEPAPKHSPWSKRLSMAWSQPLYQMSPWSLSKSKLQKRQICSGNWCTSKDAYRRSSWYQRLKMAQFWLPENTAVSSCLLLAGKVIGTDCSWALKIMLLTCHGQN